MPSLISMLMQTEYDGTGVSKFRDGMAEVETSGNNVVASSDKIGFNYESLSKKMERPLGRVAFHGLAEDILGANGAAGELGGSTMALSSGLHALGNAALFAGGEFAMIAIGAVAVYEIYEKIFGASEKAAASHSELAKSAADESVAYKSAADQLSALGPKYADVAAQMEKGAAASKASALAILNEEIATDRAAISDSARADSMKKAADAVQKQQQATGSLLGTSEQYEMQQMANVGLTQSQTKASENLTDRQEKLKLALVAVSALMDKPSNDKSDTSSINAVNDAIQKRNISMMSAITIMKAMHSQEGRLYGAEREFIATTDPIKKKSLADEIIGLNKKISAEQAALNKSKQLENQEERMLKKRAATYDKYLSAVADSVEVHGKAVCFNGRKFLGEELKDAANQAASYLEIMAAKYFYTGNYAAGALALAGAAVVKTAAAAGAALLEADTGGDTSSASSPSMDSSNPAQSTLDSSSSNNSNVKPMVLNVQVNALHAGTAQELGVQLAKILNQAIDVSGAQLKATTLQTSGNWVAV